MKILVTLIFITFVTSCKEKSDYQNPPSTKNRTWLIHLDHKLGQLRIELPKQFDTLFKWTEYSDCSGCEHIDYRVQNKSLPVFKESGFVYYPLEDSIEQFTIKHQILVDTTGNKDNDFKPLPRDKGNSLSLIYGKEQIVIDTQLLVNKRYFNVGAASIYNSARQIKINEVEAHFLLNGNLIKIKFEYRKSHSDSLEGSFINNAIEAIKTIEIL